MGHTKFNSSLSLFGKHKSGSCDPCNQMVTVAHVIFLYAPKYANERLVLKSGLECEGIKYMDIKTTSQLTLERC